MKYSPEIQFQFNLYVNIRLVLTKYTDNYNCEGIRNVWKQEMKKWENL